ncbi:MAG: hypothetical protein U9R02_14030 [Thermodesulfobacteriota bacterium]|nr:hypothetical protein [Thermodesulfobacteriota bacterium]
MITLEGHLERITYYNEENHYTVARLKTGKDQTPVTVTGFMPAVSPGETLKPKLSDFLLDLHQSLAHQGFAKILDISTGMPVVFANPYASRSRHISSQ